MRRRSGYRALDTEDIANHTAIIDDDDTVVPDTVDGTEGVDERELVKQEGWMDLIYSFWASGAMTVNSLSVSFGVSHFFSSSQHTSFRSFSLYRSLGNTLLANGYGHSPLVYHTLAKVRIHFWM